MRVAINITDGRYRVNKSAMTKLAMDILRDESADHKFVHIIYCRDREMIPLNRKFKGKNRTTDVLSFSLGDDDEPDFLGEVYISLEQAKRQAREFNVPYTQEIRRLTIHGILHLLGYRDDSDRRRKTMWRRQESFING